MSGGQDMNEKWQAGHDLMLKMMGPEFGSRAMP